MASIAPQRTFVSVNAKEHQRESRSERRALSDEMIRLVLLHVAGLDASALREYTFERYKTDYPDAKGDIDIFDGAGRLVFQGGEFHSGMAGYWRPSRISAVREGVSTESSWGRNHAGRVL